MKLWRVIPLFALAQASCYDYEYYDPDTGASIPGNACAKQQAAAAGGTTSIGQPLTSSSTFGASTPLASSYAPVATFSSAATTYPSALSYSTAAPVYGSTPVATSYPIASAPVYSSTTIASSYPVTTVAATVAPAAVTVSTRSAASSSASSSQQAQLQYYQQLAQRQAQQHQQNARIVKRASKDLSRASLINTVVAGGGVSPFYPVVRLNDQKQAADAYKSEKRIAEKNADDAYQRYQQDPSRLNLLVSKYQDLNADLRSAAYQYNVDNSGTFGQSVAATSIFGVSGGLFNTITQVVTERKQSSDLQDIQQKMQRVERQIASEVQVQTAQLKASNGASSASVSAAPAGSVQQRMMALSVYGPAQG